MKGFVFIIICLLIWLIYQDLSKSPLLTAPAAPSLANSSELTTVSQPASYTAVRMQVEAGDTILSLTEKINGSRSINIEQLKRDFIALNPEQAHQALQIGQFYEFPLYH